MREIEVKILEINPEEIRKKLLDLGAKKIFDGEVNTVIFDFPDKRLGKEKKLLRVRRVGEQAELCFKSKNKSDSFLTSEEIEVFTSNFEDTVKIIDSLDFIRRYEGKRRRETYKLGKIRFEIDDYSTMPVFMEVEAPTEEEVQEYVEKLGYTMDQTTNKNALEVEEYYKNKK